MLLAAASAATCVRCQAECGCVAQQSQMSNDRCRETLLGCESLRGIGYLWNRGPRFGRAQCLDYTSVRGYKRSKSRAVSEKRTVIRGLAAWENVSFYSTLSRSGRDWRQLLGICTTRVRPTVSTYTQQLSGSAPGYDPIHPPRMESFVLRSLRDLEYPLCVHQPTLSDRSSWGFQYMKNSAD